MTRPPSRATPTGAIVLPSEQPYVAAWGSAAGKAHRDAGRNNQDAAAVLSTGSIVAACVSDGCSALPAAEVGAALTARTAVRAAVQWAESRPDALPSEAMEPVLDEVVTMLRRVAAAVGGAGEGPEQVVAEMLLATMLVALVTPRGAAVFGVGDGVVALDRDVRIEHATGGGASYPGYRVGELGPAPELRLFFVAAPERWSSITLASDGGERLFARGKTPVSALTGEAYARSAALRWQLESQAREAARDGDDDVTVAVLARRRAESG